jgi:hypothetical protein
MGKMSALSAREWIELINEPAFAEDATLEASVLNEPAVGATEIRCFFDATRKMYESIAFVHEASSNSHMYLAWEGIFAGNAVAGVTVLCRNASGAISRIWLHHRPFELVLAFSAKLAAIRSRAPGRH